MKTAYQVTRQTNVNGETLQTVARYSKSAAAANAFAARLRKMGAKNVQVTKL